MLYEWNMNIERNKTTKFGVYKRKKLYKDMDFN